MNRQIWETLFTALQSWEQVNFNAMSERDFKDEQKCFNEAIDYLLSVEPNDSCEGQS